MHWEACQTPQFSYKMVNLFNMNKYGIINLALKINNKTIIFTIANMTSLESKLVKLNNPIMGWRFIQIKRP